MHYVVCLIIYLQKYAPTMFAQGRHGELGVDGLWELKEGNVAVFIMPLAWKMLKIKGADNCLHFFCCLCHLPISVTPQLSQEVLVPPARIFVQIQIHEIKYIEIHCYCWKILPLRVWAVQIQIEWPDVQRKAQCSLLLAGCSRPQFSYGAFIVNIDH